MTVPQVHRVGEEAEVDFGALWVWLDGTLTKVWLLVLRLSAWGKAFHLAFASQAAEAFLEGLLLAFQALGGVPRRVRYDNLRAAVDRILPGRDRVGEPAVHRAAQPRWVRLVLLPARQAWRA